MDESAGSSGTQPRKRKRGPYKRGLYDADSEINRRLVNKYGLNVSSLSDASYAAPAIHESSSNDSGEVFEDRNDSLESTVDREEINEFDDDSDEDPFQFSDSSCSSCETEDTEDEYFVPEREELLKPLFFGGKSKSNLGEALIGLCEIFKKHYCSKSLLGDLISFVYKLMPESTVFPKSKYYFYNIMDKLVPDLDNNASITFFCAVCQLEFGTKNVLKCSKCGSAKSAVLVKNDVELMLRNLFENKNFSKLIDEYQPFIRDRNPNEIRDIVDGKKYQAISGNKSKYDLALIYNTDGFPVSGSSKAQVWPNFFTISDIRPNVRQSFILMHSLYYSPLKPSMKNFLPHVVKDISEIAKNGIEWTDPITKVTQNTKANIICATVDAQARHPIQNINPYNADFGCSFCEIRGKRIAVGRGTAHTYPFSNRDYRERTTLNMVNNAYSIRDDISITRARNQVGVFEPPDHVKGVLGYSCFSLLDNFDLGSSFSPDYLHSCLLGVVKRQLFLITNSKYSSEQFYIGKMVNLINKTLKSFTPPNTFRRLPRSLDDLKNWKGSEYRNWLLFYSLPCLEKFWPIAYLKHHALLVYSIHTLLKDCIKKEELNLVRFALKEYCKDYPQLYRTEDQTFNLHMLLHYVSSVEELGPLFSHSTFVFESANFRLGKSIHANGTIIAKELILTGKIHNFYNALSFICGQSNALRGLEGKCLKYLGAPRPVSTIESDVVEFTNNLVFSDDGQAHEVNYYCRAQIDGTTYTTESYKNCNKTCTYYALYEKNEEKLPCLIVYFIEVNGKKYFIGKKLNVLERKYNTSIAHVDVEHIIQFEPTNVYQLCATKSIILPLFVIENVGRQGGEALFCIPPNLVEINL